MSSFFLPNWSPPDDPARPLPAEGRPWPSDDDDDDDANNAVGQRTCEYEDDDKMKEGTLAVTALITIPGN